MTRVTSTTASRSPAALADAALETLLRLCTDLEIPPETSRRAAVNLLDHLRRAAERDASPASDRNPPPSRPPAPSPANGQASHPSPCEAAGSEAAGEVARARQPADGAASAPLALPDPL